MLAIRKEKERKEMRNECRRCNQEACTYVYIHTYEFTEFVLKFRSTRYFAIAHPGIRERICDTGKRPAAKNETNLNEIVSKIIRSQLMFTFTRHDVLRGQSCNLAVTQKHTRRTLGSDWPSHVWCALYIICFVLYRDQPISRDQGKATTCRVDFATQSKTRV